MKWSEVEFLWLADVELWICGIDGGAEMKVE